MMDGCWWVVTGYMASVLTITEAKGSAKFLIKKNIVEPMVPVPQQPKQKSVFTPRVITEAKRYPLLASPQYVSVLKPRQNAKNNRSQKPLLHWCLSDFELPTLHAQLPIDLFLCYFFLIWFFYFIRIRLTFVYFRIHGNNKLWE